MSQEPSATEVMSEQRIKEIESYIRACLGQETLRFQDKIRFEPKRDVYDNGYGRCCLNAYKSGHLRAIEEIAECLGLVHTERLWETCQSCGQTYLGPSKHHTCLEVQKNDL